MLIEIDDSIKRFIRRNPFSHYMIKISPPYEPDRYTLVLNPNNEFFDELLKYGGKVKILEPGWVVRDFEKYKQFKIAELENQLAHLKKVDDEPEDQDQAVNY